MKCGTAILLVGTKTGNSDRLKSLLRKHAAALVNRATKLKATKPFVPFKDVSTKNAFFNDVKKLQQAGIFEPDAKGNLYPNQPITRAEMAKVLTIAYDLKVKVDLDFIDVFGLYNQRVLIYLLSQIPTP